MKQEGNPAAMNTTRLLQIPIVLTLLFASVGTSQPVSASTDPQLRGIQQTPPSVSITILPALISLHESATATVSLNDVPAGGYTSAEFNCTYRADLVQVSDIVLTGLFGPDPATAIYDPQDGTFIVGVAGSQGNKAPAGGPVFTFHVKGLGTGQATLDCTARVSDGTNVLTGIGSATAGLTVMEATATPTLTPVPCDRAEFIADITVPAGTVMSPGAQFTKTWRLKNVGSCTWTTSYRIALLSGEPMGAPSSIRLPVDVAPGQMVDLSLEMIAPSAPGSYRGYWIFQNDTGSPFGIGLLGNQPWFVDIVVSDATLTPTATQTPSLTPTPMLSPTPTFTPTPTLTPTPIYSPTYPPEAYGMLDGHASAGKPVIVSIFDVNNTLVVSVAASDIDGFFGIAVLPGTYTVIARADGFLSARGSVTMTAGSTSTMPAITLLAGDIDNNNVIDQFDVLTIGMNYNSTLPFAADLNNDGIINVLDLELLAGNYRKTGPANWQ